MREVWRKRKEESESYNRREKANVSKREKANGRKRERETGIKDCMKKPVFGSLSLPHSGTCNRLGLRLVTFVMGQRKEGSRREEREINW